MKTVELTDREQTILVCLVGIKMNEAFQENTKMDMKQERFTDEEIEKYDCNSKLMNELSILSKKLLGE